MLIRKNQNLQKKEVEGPILRLKQHFAYKYLSRPHRPQILDQSAFFLQQQPTHSGTDKPSSTSNQTHRPDNSHLLNSNGQNTGLKLALFASAMIGHLKKIERTTNQKKEDSREQI